MSEIMVSVVIPVYNVENYLEECLESVLNQTYSELEIICVDDGSTDRSLQILQEYAKKDERVRVVSQQNKGAGAARNHGIKLANGRYIYFMDSDDYCDAALLEKTVAAAETLEADIVAFHYYVFDEEGVVTERDGYQKKMVEEGQETVSYRDLPDTIMSFVNPTPWNKLYRRAFIENTGIRYEEISSTNDITFAGVSVARAEKIGLLDEHLLYYRKGHSGTITSIKTKNLNNVYIAVESAVRQVMELSYGREIVNSIRRFAVSNLYFATKNYVVDFKAEGVKEYYENMRRLLCEEPFTGAKEGEMGPAEYYDFYCAVKQADYEKMKEIHKARVIVSVTSFPDRINDVAVMLESILNQTKPADMILVYLAEEQFLRKEEELPDNLRRLVADGKVVVKWCDNLMPHKKYFYAMQEYPDDIIVTIDDDLLYNPKMLEILYQSYLRYPDAISAMRTHIMGVTSAGKIMPYELWVKEYARYLHKPSLWLFATTGAGTLFPPCWRPEILFDKEGIRKTCLCADDLWVNVCRILTHTAVVTVKDSGKIKRLITDGDHLYELNGAGGMNDSQLNAICEYLKVQNELPAILLAEKDRDCFSGEEFLYNEMYRMKMENRQQIADKNKHIAEKNRQIADKNKQIKKHKKQYDAIVKSRSYKLVSAMKKVYKTVVRGGK